MKQAVQRVRALGGSSPPIEEIQHALSATPAGHAGWRVVDRRPCAYHSTFPIEQLILRDPTGVERAIAFKDLSRTTELEPSWQVRARFVQEPLREIVCYRDVLSPARISAPAYIGCSVLGDRGRYWLFLEWLRAAPLWQLGDLRSWCRAAAWLAAMHTRFEGRGGELPEQLIVHDHDHWQTWLDRARRMLYLRGRGGSSTEIDGLLERAQTTVDWLVRLPTTLLHGDFYPSNVLVERTERGPRIRPLDWELAGIGPGILDLAALVSGDWTDRERGAMISAYRNALPRTRRPSQPLLRWALRRGRLLLAVRWLGWSTRWRPPREHARDWLATALDLARADNDDAFDRGQP